MRNAAFIAFGAVLLVGCGDDDGGSDVPDRLYLALLDSELSVQLVEQEPEPF